MFVFRIAHAVLRPKHNCRGLVTYSFSSFMIEKILGFGNYSSTGRGRVELKNYLVCLLVGYVTAVMVLSLEDEAQQTVFTDTE